MSVRTILGQRAIPPETFVQPVEHGHAIVASEYQGNIPPIQMRRDYVPDDSEDERQFHPPSQGASKISRIAVKAKGRVLFLDPMNVVVAKAQGNYVALVHQSGSYLVRETMATAEEKLIPVGFVRIHRSTLVNGTLVKELRRDNTGTYLVRTADGSEHAVGRAYKDNLKVIARSWLGVELE